MDDVDPFGRRKDENPLAGLGWHEHDPAGTPEPAAPFNAAGRPSRTEPYNAAGRPARTEPAEPAADPPRRPERRPPPRPDSPAVRPARVLRGMFGFVVVLVAGGALLSAFSRPALERAERFARSLTTPAAPPAAIPGGSGEPRGLARGSLLRPAAFRLAVARLRSGGHGRLTNLRVAPERIDAILLTQDGRMRIVRVAPDGVARVVHTSARGFAGAKTMSLAAIDAGAPQRLTRSAAGRLERSTSDVRYLVYSQFGGTMRWTVFFGSGAAFSADARGRIVRRIG